ncbi:MAG: phosphatidylserine decarboxylase family protein [Acidobacteria bacterium]|jgi:phosphatidylserine decarboxylase|nr:MAG: phosphatidylserine decarboxylase family protein [Acidobacteriota bacterium]PYV89296.1 MAG: phosphatidylserine decarboxylase family protein [Acidobacteriota bacterium]
MVRDGYYYGSGFIAAALVLGWLSRPAWSLPLWLLAAFFLWFFRDPERAVPQTAGVIVSPADGKVTDVSEILVDGEASLRISIFLSVFDVHVNRSPIAGQISDVRYKEGKFLNAMGADCASSNEQNIVTVRSDRHTVVFKQIAGLLARRIVFTKKLGERVAAGERVGLIKFGSRVDVVLNQAEVSMKVKPGDRVKGGSSILGYFNSEINAGATTTAETVKVR